jgi:hypothetical protein
MEDIKVKFSTDIAKKILGNKERACDYLFRFHTSKKINDLKFKKINRGKNINTYVLDSSTEELWQIIVNNWDYEKSKKIIRDMFKETDKYKSGKDANNAMNILINKWKLLKLGNIAWPFSQGAFDEFVQRINSEKEDGKIKDEKVKVAAVKYRRIKEINTVRNDFIETLIFEKNDNIIPTLNHRRGVDFFINGVSYDQKVAKSPTNEFKKKYPKNWRDMAIINPAEVAEYLYTYQDEGRFGADPRLLVVYIDEDVSVDKIKQIIDKTDLDKPIEINFTYKHKNAGAKQYKVPCFIILLYNSKS